jgi:hypothetical protein
MAVMQNVKSKIVLIAYCWINICGVKDGGIKSRIVIWDHRKRARDEGTWQIGPDELAELGEIGSHILIACDLYI